MNIGRFWLFIEAIPFCVFIFLGVFTLVYDVFLLAGLSFGSLLPVAPVCAAGAVVLTWLSCRRPSRRTRADANSGAAGGGSAAGFGEKPFPLLPVIGALGVVLFFGLSKNYIISWGLALLWLLFCLHRENKTRRSTKAAPPVEFKTADILWPLLIALAYALLAFLVKRPDEDDATFLGIAVYLLNNPAEAIFRGDPLFHGEKFAHWAQLFEAWHALVAVTAHFFNTSPGVAAHYILGPAAAFLFPLVWSGFFLRLGLSPRQVMPVLFVAGFVFAETHASFGNFTFVRFFQGKAWLANLLVPYILMLTYDFSRRRAGISAVSLACVAAFGCSFSAIFVVPQALGAALIAHWSKITLRRAVLLLFPVLAYTAILGLVFFFGSSLQFKELITNAASQNLPNLLNQVFGSVQKYIVLFLLICAWAFLPSPSIRRGFLLLTILWLAVPLNPLSGFLVSKIVSPHIAWREFWVIPFWGVVGTGLWGITRAQYGLVMPWGGGNLRGRGAIPGFGIIKKVRPYARLGIFLALMLPFVNMRPSNIERFGPDFFWYPIRYASILAAVEREVEPRRIIMGPRHISAWLSTLPEGYSVWTYRGHEMASGGIAAERSAAIRILTTPNPSPADKAEWGDILGRVKPQAVVTLRESVEFLLPPGYVNVFSDDKYCLLIRAD